MSNSQKNMRYVFYHILIRVEYANQHELTKTVCVTPAHLQCTALLKSFWLQWRLRLALIYNYTVVSSMGKDCICTLYVQSGLKSHRLCRPDTVPTCCKYIVHVHAVFRPWLCMYMTTKLKGLGWVSFV